MDIQFENILETATRKKNVIENVRVCGLVSANGRRYAPSALSTAAHLYENADVYLNHGTRPRPIEDKIGYLTNIQFKESTGLWGTLHLNEKHANYEQIVWFADNNSSKIGLSHDVDGTYNKAAGIVEEIKTVHSVDLVSKAATVNGLTEGLATEKNRLDTVVSKVSNLTYGCVWPGELSYDEQIAKVSATYTEAISELKSLTNTKEEVMDWSKVTAEELHKNVPHLVEAILAPVKAAHATALTEAVAVAVAEEKSFQEALTKLPEKARTGIFEKQLRAAVKVGAEEVKSLVEAVTELAGGQKVVSPRKPAEEVVLKEEEEKFDPTTIAAKLGIKE